MQASAVTPPFAVAAALLAIAGATKLRAPGPLASRALGVAEAALATVALVAPSALVAGLVACAYAAFAGHVMRRLVAGRGEPCGCFGAHSTRATPVHLALNLAAAAVAALALAQPPHGVAWLTTLAPAVAVALTLGVAAATYAAYLAFTALPEAWRAWGAASRV